ncbi:hypothetical protein DAI22_07g117500 [Oryza sativa Japonica Group]|nr:hypothetical protein DAI22_07g117500 [Oryza sativa Japonica Group]
MKHKLLKCLTVAPPPTSSTVEPGHRGAADGYQIQQHNGQRRKDRGGQQRRRQRPQRQWREWKRRWG